MAENEDMKSGEISDDKEKKPAKKTSKKDAEKARVNNSIEINPKLEEAVTRTVVFSFGRMNPVTIGHEKLVNKVLLEAKKNNGTPVVYLSHSQDPKKNPLSYNDKVRIAQKAFGKVIKSSNAKTIIQVMQELDKTFDKAILIVGADRVKEFETLLTRYNGKDYNFDNITVMSAGERDPDAEGVEGMSASKMRAAASSGEKDAFISGLPKKLQRDGEAIYDMVRAGMKLAEELEAQGLLSEALNFSQRRQRAITMRRYKNKIAMARKRMMKRPATPEKIKVRAKKKAIAIVKAKIAGKRGADYATLSAAEKQMIDKKVEKRKTLIQRIAKRLIPQIRKADRERLSSSGKNVNEAFENYLEQNHAPTKKYHEARKKDGSIKLDGRFRAFRDVKEDAENILKQQHKQERINLSREHEREMDSLKTREMRLKIRDLKKDDNRFEEQFDLEENLLSLIEEISEDIHNSILEDTSKALDGLKAKSEKSGIPLEVVVEAYNRGVKAWEEANTDDTAQQWGYARVNALIAGGKKDSDLLEEVDLNSFFDLNEQFELMESSILDKALAAIHKHVTAGSDLGDMSFKVSRAAGVTFSAQDLRKKYIEKFGNPSDRKADPERINKLKRKYGFNENYGAGFEGTDTLVQNYKNATPGESGSKKKPKISDWSPFVKDEKAKKINEAFETLVEDKGTVKHHLGIDTKGSSMKHMMKHATKHIDYDMDGDVDADDFKKSVPDEITGAEKKNLTKAAFAKYKREKQHTRKGVAFEEVEPLSEDKCDLIGIKQIKEFEKLVDRLFEKFGIDFNFTKHFGERMSDERNTPCITMRELADFIKKIYANQGKSLKGVAGAEAVIKDMQTDLNIPVAVNYDSRNDEFDVVMKTIMRKKNFKTPNKVIKY